MLLGLLGYYPLHYGVMDFLDLRVETLTTLETLWLLLLFCLEFLGFTPRYWVVCLLCVQVILITCFVRDLEFICIQLLLCPIFVKTYSLWCLVFLRGLSSLLVWFQFQRMRILHLLIVLSVGFLLVRWFLSLAFTLYFRIVPSSPPIFFNFKNLLSPFEKHFLFF